MEYIEIKILVDFFLSSCFFMCIWLAKYCSLYVNFISQAKYHWTALIQRHQCTALVWLLFYLHKPTFTIATSIHPSTDWGGRATWSMHQLLKEKNQVILFLNRQTTESIGVWYAIILRKKFSPRYQRWFTVGCSPQTVYNQVDRTK